MKRGTPRHPKTYALAENLGVPLYAAVGLLEMLWHHGNQHTQRGDIGSIPDRAIAEACGWTKKPSLLIDALVASRWIDRDKTYRLVLHDWPDHCEQSSVKWLEYNHTNFLPVYGESLEKRRRISRESLAPREARQGKAGIGDVVLETSTEEQKEPLRARDLALVPVTGDDFEKIALIFIRLGHLALTERDKHKSVTAWSSLDAAERREAIEYAQQQALGEWGQREVKYLPRIWNYLEEKHWQRKEIVQGRQKAATKGEITRDIVRDRFLKETKLCN